MNKFKDKLLAISETTWQKERNEQVFRRNRARGKFLRTMLTSYFHQGNLRVLEMGCGAGWLCVELAKKYNSVFGIDSDSKVLKLAKLNAKEQAVHVKYLKQDACRTKFKKNYFDVVILSHLLEHADSHRLPIRQAYRILKRKGVVILVSPNKLWPLEQHYGLPFLHWLSRPLADRYVNMLGRAKDYSEVKETPSYLNILKILDEEGFEHMDLSYKKLAAGPMKYLLEEIPFLRYCISIFSPGWVLFCTKGIFKAKRR